LEELTAFFVDAGATTDPYCKLVEESGLARIFGTELLKKEEINLDGSHIDFAAN
jgi:hypothetical protein